MLNSKIILYIRDTIFYSQGVLQIYNPKIYYECYILFILLLVNLALQSFWQIMIVKFSFNLAIGGKPKDEKGNEYFKDKNNL